MEKKGRKERSDPKCRGCSITVGEDAVKIGKRKYHPDCAQKKPRSRQRFTGLGWERVGVWSDEEQATMEATREG